MDYSIIYSISQCIICLFSSAIFLGMWHLGLPQRFSGPKVKPRKDPAMLYTGLAVLAWGITGGILFTAKIGVTLSPWIEPTRYFFSTINSTFFLLAVAHLYHAPGFLGKLEGNKTWSLIVISFGVIIGLITWLLAYYNLYGKIFKIPDTILSLATIALFAIYIWKSFYRRRMKFFGHLTIISILILAAAQILELFKVIPDDYLQGLNLSAKVNFILLFIVLLVSYYRELLENPEMQDTAIELIQVDKKGNGKAIVSVKGMGQKVESETMTPRVFECLVYLAFARKRQSEEQGWVNLEKHIYNATLLTSIKRALHLHSVNLIDADFAGSRRLHVAPENITYDSSLIEAHKVSWREAASPDRPEK